VERFGGCEFARAVVHSLYTEKDRTGICGRLQALACYYVQLFYMARSLRHEDVRVVAVAGAFLACKVCEVPRRMRDVLRSHNNVRIKSGRPELDEDEQRALRERVLKVELLLLRIMRFEVELFVVPWEELDVMADQLLARLAVSATFREACVSRQPVEEANNLKPKLLQVAKSFMQDAYMGLGPLRVQPRVVAAGALAVAVRYIRREMNADDVARLLELVDVSLEKIPVGIATDEIFNVYKAKNGWQGPASKMGKRAAPSSAIGPISQTQTPPQSSTPGAGFGGNAEHGGTPASGAAEASGHRNGARRTAAEDNGRPPKLQRAEGETWQAGKVRAWPGA